MRLYVSGKMTGEPFFNIPAFASAAATLRSQGHVVTSPSEVSPPVEGKLWTDYLRKDLVAMLLHADAIVMLPGWEASKGACLEHHVATALGYQVFVGVDSVPHVMEAMAI